ncbi:hypothetical protein EON66_01345 [archaeon]|nr:MAG: hypothetical protein EON66_01345 [archaeon]
MLACKRPTRYVYWLALCLLIALVLVISFDHAADERRHVREGAYAVARSSAWASNVRASIAGFSEGTPRYYAVRAASALVACDASRALHSSNAHARGVCTLHHACPVLGVACRCEVARPVRVLQLARLHCDRGKRGRQVGGSHLRAHVASHPSKPSAIASARGTRCLSCPARLLAEIC